MNEKNINKEHYIFEALREYPAYYVYRNDVDIGDTIIYIANNQLASKKYLVIPDPEGDKSLQEQDFNTLTYKGGKKKLKIQHKRTRKQRFKSKIKKSKKQWQTKK